MLRFMSTAAAEPNELPPANSVKGVTYSDAGLLPYPEDTVIGDRLIHFAWGNTIPEVPPGFTKVKEYLWPSYGYWQIVCEKVVEDSDRSPLPAPTAAYHASHLLNVGNVASVQYGDFSYTDFDSITLDALVPTGPISLAVYYVMDRDTGPILVASGWDEIAINQSGVTSSCIASKTVSAGVSTGGLLVPVFGGGYAAVGCLIILNS